MMNQNIKTYLLLLVIISSNLLAQKSSFIYELKYKPHTDSTKIDSIIYYLDTDKSQSLFRSKMFRKSDSLLVKRGYPNGFDTEFNNKQLYVKKDTKSNTILKYVFIPIAYSTFAIEINDKLNWKILPEKLKIGTYLCQKAETSYGGRTWSAWFTSEISISDGPYIFSGLPGLIIKINDEKLDYEFDLVQIKNFEWKELYPAKYQKLITWSDFQKIQTDFYNNPMSTLKKGDVLNEDASGNLSEANFKEMRGAIQQRIRTKNNPIELNYKIDFK
jgi:GLPGLI family protein